MTPALKPWLQANVGSLAKCEASGEVTVSAKFGAAPDVTLDRVDGDADGRCVKAVLATWKNDGHQPRAGSFKFRYRLQVPH